MLMQKIVIYGSQAIWEFWTFCSCNLLGQNPFAQTALTNFLSIKCVFVKFLKDVMIAQNGTM